MAANFDDFETEPVKRPSFLTTLCILTFIGSGWALCSGVWNYFTAAKTVAKISEARNIQDSSMRADSALNKDTAQFHGERKRHIMFGMQVQAAFSKIITVSNIRKASIGSFISALFTLLGALLMWRLNRKGFYSYILGVLISIIVPFLIYGNNLPAVGIAFISGFFGLLFIVLYALNLKSMNPGNTEIQ